MYLLTCTVSAPSALRSLLRMARSCSVSGNHRGSIPRVRLATEKRALITGTAFFARASCVSGPTRLTRTLTSTRDPSRLMMDISRSAVNRSSSALRIRE